MFYPSLFWEMIPEEHFFMSMERQDDLPYYLCSRHPTPIKQQEQSDACSSLRTDLAQHTIIPLARVLPLFIV